MRMKGMKRARESTLVKVLVTTTPAKIWPPDIPVIAYM